MAKDLSISYLLDFYGQMLTDKQREVTEFYYNDDLSLAEIADHCHITRQGVRDSIKRAEAQLREYEEKLGLARRFVEIQEMCIRDSSLRSTCLSLSVSGAVRSRSGRLRKVFSSDFSRRHWSILAWLPFWSTSGTSRPCHTGGRV